MLRFLTLLAALTVYAAPAWAQDPAELIESISAEELAVVVDTVAAAYGIEASFDIQSPEETTRLINVDAGLRFSFVLYGCDEAGSCPIVSGFATFEGPVYLEQTNDWNRAARFSRAYVDGNRAGVIEDDLLLGGGVTRQAVTLYVNAFFVSLAEFADFLSGAEEEEAAPEEEGNP